MAVTIVLATLDVGGLRILFNTALRPTFGGEDLVYSMKRRDGTIDALYSHWVLGKQAVKRQPRWSILRNVLHWVE